MAGLDITNGKPLFAANDTQAHVTGVDDEDKKGVTDSGGGYADFFMGQRQGVTDSGGGFADFFRGQREGYKVDREVGVGDFLLAQEKKTYGATIEPSYSIGKKGYVSINGQQNIPIMLDTGLNDYSDDITEKINLSFDKRNLWDMISHFNITAGVEYEQEPKQFSSGQGVVTNSAEQQGSMQYTSGQGAVAGAAAIIEAAQNVLDAKRHFEIGVNKVDLHGKEGVLITYYENIKDVINIFGSGHSTMTKMQKNDQFGAIAGYTFDGDYQNIDEKHLTNRTTGYIYVQDGKMMVRPIRYMDDQIVQDGKDITNLFFQPFELDTDAVILIDTKLKEQGIDLGLNMKYYKE